MEEQLVTFKTAKLAKEKGFDISTLHWFNTHGYLLEKSIEPDCDTCGVSISDIKKLEFSVVYYEAPTQSLLQRWLRESRNIHIGVSTSEIGWECNLYEAEKAKFIDVVYGNSFTFRTYEEALEKGLYEALKLI